ncbi:MAG: exodeoxyribonuclease VII large subunit [Balneolaceae bacterium]|nr:exodeoxyribonuclease VII large subunit [Balneolaceae bacterium]
MPQSELFTPSTLSVSDLTGEIKEILEGHFPDVRVEGEVSNASRSRSGHVYFTLKDEDAQLSCVIWRSTRSRREIELEDGQQIVAGGEIQVYPLTASTSSSCARWNRPERAPCRRPSKN